MTTSWFDEENGTKLRIAHLKQYTYIQIYIFVHIFVFQIQSVGQALHNVSTEKDDTKLLIEVNYCIEMILCEQASKFS